MTGGLVAFALITGVTGLLILLLGYLIKAKQLAGLIAGFDPRQVKDVRGLTNWVGTNAMLVGALISVYGLIPLFLRQMPGILFHLGFALVLVVLTLWTAGRASRF